MLHFSSSLKDKLCLNTANTIECNSEIGTYAHIFEPLKDTEIQEGIG